MTRVGQTLGDQAADSTAITHPHEREALVLLANAGWTQRELAMVFQVGESTVSRVITDETGGSQ